MIAVIRSLDAPRFRSHTVRLIRAGRSATCPRWFGRIQTAGTRPCNDPRRAGTMSSLSLDPYGRPHSLGGSTAVLTTTVDSIRNLSLSSPCRPCSQWKITSCLQASKASGRNVPYTFLRLCFRQTLAISLHASTRCGGIDVRVVSMVMLVLQY
jgi:hypothetical protein